MHVIGICAAAAAALLDVQVDATALMCDDVELAVAVMNNTGKQALLYLLCMA
jgi:hypothetical protein